MDWIAEIRTAGAAVETWILAMPPDRWLEPRAGGWTDKDVLGHLAAWSDLLMDQVEALRQERPEIIETINVDVWNADQVARRRSWTVEATIAAWRRSVQRAYAVLADLQPNVWNRRWTLAWAARSVSIGDLVGLWLDHVDQHRSRLKVDPR